MESARRLHSAVWDWRVGVDVVSCFDKVGWRCHTLYWLQGDTGVSKDTGASKASGRGRPRSTGATPGAKKIPHPSGAGGASSGACGDIYSGPQHQVIQHLISADPLADFGSGGGGRGPGGLGQKPGPHTTDNLGQPMTPEQPRKPPQLQDSGQPDGPRTRTSSQSTHPLFSCPAWPAMEYPRWAARAAGQGPSSRPGVMSRAPLAQAP